jgi:hypothetical protein
LKESAFFLLSSRFFRRRSTQEKPGFYLTFPEFNLRKVGEINGERWENREKDSATKKRYEHFLAPFFVRLLAGLFFFPQVFLYATSDRFPLNHSARNRSLA